VSLDDALSLRSASAGSRTREERDDRFRPILPPGAAAGRPQMSKLERIKSSGSVIDKPSLIRTISKMEDVLLASQLNPLPARVVRLGQRAMANDAEDDDDNDDDDGGLDSPRTVHGHDGDAPMTPTGEACNILAALQLSREAEGLFASVVSMFVSSPRDPITPVSKDGNDDDASSSTPMTSSPGSEASFVSSSISAAVAKPSLAKRNTCGTIYLGSTLSAPDKDALIKCVCGVFRAHMLMGAELRGSHGLLPLDLPALANGGRVHHHLIDIRRATCQDDERQAHPPSGELALGAVLVHGPRLKGLGRSEHVELRLLEDWTVGDDVHAFAHERA